MPARAAAWCWVLPLWRSRSMMCTSASVFMGTLLTRVPWYKIGRERRPRSTVLIVVTHKSNYRSTGMQFVNADVGQITNPVHTRRQSLEQLRLLQKRDIGRRPWHAVGHIHYLA